MVQKYATFSLTSLVDSVGMHFAGNRFQEMPTTQNMTVESLYIATHVLASVSFPAIFVAVGFWWFFGVFFFCFFFFLGGGGE